MIRRRSDTAEPSEVRHEIRQVLPLLCEAGVDGALHIEDVGPPVRQLAPQINAHSRSVAPSVNQR